MEPCILGIGPVLAVGNGVASLRAALEGAPNGRAKRIDGRGCGVPAEPSFYAADAEGLERFVPRRSLRRLDKFTQMALLSSYLAVEDAGVSFRDRSRLGIVLGTAYGPQRTTFAYQDTISDEGDAGASPTLFANSIHNAQASAVSIFMQITGPCLTISTFERTTEEVLRVARLWLEQGAADYVLAGVGDETSGALRYSVRQRGARSTGAPNPLQLERCSYIPGEAFVTFLLGAHSQANGSARLERVVSAASPTQLDRELLAAHRAIILSANGDRQTGPLYRPVGRSGIPVAAYSALYGSLPSGLGVDLAAAALSCRLGCVCRPPGGSADPALNVLTDDLPVQSGQRVGCLACSPGHTTLISVIRT